MIFLQILCKQETLQINFVEKTVWNVICIIQLLCLQVNPCSNCIPEISGNIKIHLSGMLGHHIMKPPNWVFQSHIQVYLGCQGTHSYTFKTVFICPNIIRPSVYECFSLLLNFYIFAD